MNKSNRPIPKILRQNSLLSNRHIRTRVSVALIKNDSVYLLKSIIEGKEAWFLPGGSVKWGESLIEGIKREIAEELGINVHLSHVVGILNVLTETNDYHSVEIIFSGKPQKMPTLTSESNEQNETTENQYSIEGKWFNLSQLRSIHSYPKEIIKMALLNNKITNENSRKSTINIEEELVCNSFKK